jgi:hypothetical protein
MTNFCTLVRHGEQGCGSAEVDELNIGVYTLTYQVELDAATVASFPVLGPKQIANLAAGPTPGAGLSPHPLPHMWTTYDHPAAAAASGAITVEENDVLSRARSYSVQADPKSDNRWFITVQFRPADPGEASIADSTTPINSVASPVARAPIYWWDREVFNQVVNHDREGKAIRTKAESLYPDVIELERARSVLVVEFNVKSMAEVAYYSNAFDGAVNVSSWTVQGITAPPRFALCREVAAGPPVSEIVSSSPYTYFHLTFRFVFAGSTFSSAGPPPNSSQPITLTGNNWDHRMAELDDVYWKKNSQGSYIMDADGKRQRFVTEGQVALDNDGTRLDDGQDVLFTAWRVRREVDFNHLPF